MSLRAEEADNPLSFTSASELVRQPSRSESSVNSDQADEDVVMQSLEPSGSCRPFLATGVDQLMVDRLALSI